MLKRYAKILDLCKRVLYSYSFRYIISSVFLLGVIVFISLVAVYFAFAYRYYDSSNLDLSLELGKVAAIYDAGGAPAVDSYVTESKLIFRRARYAYLLVDNVRSPIAGDLQRWPDATDYEKGWLSFNLSLMESERSTPPEGFIARSIKFDDGNELLVASSFQEIVDNLRFLFGNLFYAFVSTVGVGMLGAFYIAWNVQRDVDSVNEGMQVIMSGNLSERLEVSDFDATTGELVVKFNTMLDRIEELLDGVKQVSNNIAHDLRTPLTRMRNQLTSLRKEAAPQQQEQVIELIEEADDLIATFNSLLRIARIELGETAEKRILFPLKDIVEEVIELYEPVAAEKNISLETDLHAVNVEGDRHLVVQAIANVLDNAIKYTNPEGSINVTLEHVTPDADFFTTDTKVLQPYAFLEITDSGKGVEQQNLTKIFERFFREESSRGQQPGNGLGLSLVKAVVDLHGGEIHLADNKPGLRFGIRLPASPFMPHLPQM